MSDYPLTSVGGATSGEEATSSTDTTKDQDRSVADDVKGQTTAGRVTRGLQAGGSSPGSSPTPPSEAGAGDDVAGVPQVTGPSTTYITSERPTSGTPTEGPLGSGYATASEVPPAPPSDPVTHPPAEGQGRTL